MKKLILSLLASLTLMQSAHAIVSNLGASEREYLAIIDALNTTFAGVISQNEFLIEMRRTSKVITIDRPTHITYKIKTLVPLTEPDIPAQAENELEANHNHLDRKTKKKQYVALLHLKPNPAIGPVLITVENIKCVRHCNISAIKNDLELSPNAGEIFE